VRTEWKFRELDKYPNRLICSDGSIYSTINGSKLALKPGKGRYLRCRMYKDKEYYSWVHRMVAYAFLGDPEKLEVHHKDRNRQNNNDWNLQIMTKKENLDLRVYNNN
jgi:hypothetical protein